MSMLKMMRSSVNRPIFIEPDHIVAIVPTQRDTCEVLVVSGVVYQVNNSAEAILTAMHVASMSLASSGYVEVK